MSSAFKGTKRKGYKEWATEKSTIQENEKVFITLTGAVYLKRQAPRAPLMIGQVSLDKGAPSGILEMLVPSREAIRKNPMAWEHLDDPSGLASILLEIGLTLDLGTLLKTSATYHRLTEKDLKVIQSGGSGDESPDDPIEEA